MFTQQITIKINRFKNVIFSLDIHNILWFNSHVPLNRVPTYKGINNYFIHIYGTLRMQANAFSANFTINYI